MNARIRSELLKHPKRVVKQLRGKDEDRMLEVLFDDIYFVLKSLSEVLIEVIDDTADEDTEDCPTVRPHAGRLSEDCGGHAPNHGGLNASTGHRPRRMGRDSCPHEGRQRLQAWRYVGSLDKLSAALLHPDEALLFDDSGLEPHEVFRISSGEVVSADFNDRLYLHHRMIESVCIATLSTGLAMSLESDLEKEKAASGRQPF